MIEAHRTPDSPEALSLELSPLWLQSIERHQAISVRDLSPSHEHRLRPLTLWALFDQPVSCVQLRIGAGHDDRHNWLGFRTTVVREVDVSKALEGLRSGLQDAHLLRQTAGDLDARPDALPQHGHWLSTAEATQQGELSSLLHSSLCDLAESLSARGNRAVLDIGIRLDGARAELADALETFYECERQLARAMSSPKLTEARVQQHLQRRERIREVVGGLGRFNVEVCLFTDQPIDPRELQWSLRLMEGRVVPRGRWHMQPPPDPRFVDVFVLDQLIGMLWAKGPEEEIPF